MSHESAQNKFVKLANVDQLTSIVVIHDEANAAQLGLQEASDGRNHRAQNSLSQQVSGSTIKNPHAYVPFAVLPAFTKAAGLYKIQAVEYKEMLTSRRNTSCVLETSKENGRTREMFEVSTDMVQFQLMNNFPSLAPPMMSRFMSCCFYKFPRMDAAVCKQRAPNADRDRLADRFAEMQQVLYVLQVCKIVSTRAVWNELYTNSFITPSRRSWTRCRRWASARRCRRRAGRLWRRSLSASSTRASLSP